MEFLISIIRSLLLSLFSGSICMMSSAGNFSNLPNLKVSTVKLVGVGGEQSLDELRIVRARVGQAVNLVRGDVTLYSTAEGDVLLTRYFVYSIELRDVKFIYGDHVGFDGHHKILYTRPSQLPDRFSRHYYLVLFEKAPGQFEVVALAEELSSLCAGRFRVPFRVTPEEAEAFEARAGICSAEQ